MVPGANQQGAIIDQAPAAFGNAFAGPRPTVKQSTRSYGANGPAWQRDFDAYQSRPY